MSQNRKEDQGSLNPVALFRTAMNARVMGNLEQVEESLVLLLTRKPDHIEGLNQLSNLLLEAGKFEKAEPYLASFASLKQQDARAWYRLGYARSKLERWDHARDAFSKAVALSPGDTEILLGMAQTLDAANNPVEALDWYVQAFRYARRNASRRTDLIKMFTDPKVYNAPQFRVFHHHWAEALVDLMNDGQMDAQQFAEAATHQLLARMEGKKNSATFTSDLYICFISEVLNTNPVIERHLTDHRRNLLMDNLETQNLDLLSRQAVVSVAMQAYQNGYLLAYDANEAEELEKLKKNLTRHKAGWYVALIAMYEPLEGLDFGKLEDYKPKWPEPVRRLIRNALSHRFRQKELIPEINRLPSILSSQQKALIARYKQENSSRWRRLFHLDGTRVTAYILNRYTGDSSLIDRQHRILIVGCGTGRHAITVSRENRRATVTAIDLSLHNLAYGIRNARTLRAGNINFIRSDVMALSHTRGRYHRIEAVNMLHQCPNPRETISHLCKLLENNGIMRLSLLNSKLRQSMEEARAAIKSMGFSDSLEDIRRLRKILMNQPQQAQLMEHFSGQAFFEVSALRDMIFPILESSSQLEEIQQILQENQLVFRGFELRPDLQTRAINRFGDQKENFCNLDQWREWELEEPDLLGPEYIFWVTKV